MRITNKNLLDRLDSLELNLEKKVSEKIESEIEGLAIMVKNSFDHAEAQFSDFKSKMEAFQKNTETKLDDIFLRLDQHAYAIDVNDLKKRVTNIEKKIGI